jgi:hypothetical protein
MGLVRSKLVIDIGHRKRDMDTDSTLRSHYLSEREHVVGLELNFRAGEGGFSTKC